MPRLLDVLDRDGEEARVVGGAVRNALLGEPVVDIDVATTAVPDEVMRRAAAAGFKPVPTGIDHGTVTVVVDGTPFEVTTLREDVETFGRHARVAFGRNWQHDAERRDFTMNALYAARDGTVHDYVGGLDDLTERRVRFIGDPAQRIAEDYLRILRFFRFHAAYGDGGLPDAAGLSACIAARAGLETLSRERVRTEMLKLLVAAHAVPALVSMSETGLLVAVLGGVPLLASFANMTKLERELSLTPDPVRRLGALAVSTDRGRGPTARAAAPRQCRVRSARVDGGRLVADLRGDRHARRARAALPARARTNSSTARCWRGRGPGAKASPTTAGTIWCCCPVAGARRCFR